MVDAEWLTSQMYLPTPISEALLDCSSVCFSNRTLNENVMNKHTLGTKKREALKRGKSLMDLIAIQK